MLFRSRSRFLVFQLIASLLLSIELAHAQSELRMRQGAYVVVPAAQGANAQAFLAQKGQALAAYGQRIEKVIGSTLVVGPRTAAAHADGADEFVAVNPQVTLEACADVAKVMGPLSICEPDYEYTLSAVPNDPQFSGLWGMAAIDAPAAWDVSVGTQDVVVAIIDTGIDYTHPDLMGNLWVNPGEIAANGIDDDGNGYIDDVYGINAAAHSGNPYDDNGHGTHVAGTIGASGNDGFGVVGVNWNVRIMPLKFLTASGSGTLSGAMEAIDYMVAMKNRGVNIRLSNNSWGGGGYSQALNNAIARARDAGILFIAAAGNESNDNDAHASYPAGYDLSNVVSVAAVDQNFNLAYFSNFGAQTVDIAAPGVSILSTVPGGGFAKLSGTSMATPHVTGALALLLASEPGITNEAAVARLYDAAVPVASLSGVVRTGRLLNVGRMVTNQTAPMPAPAPEPTSCVYSVSAGAGTPDTSADLGTEIFSDADEFNFTKVSLPFPIVFDNQAISSVTVSPNGLLYFGASPSSMDYETGRSVPASSVGMHSDLVSTTRVAYGPDYVTFFWNSYYYGNPGAGNIIIRMRLYSSGVIQNWIEFTTPAIQKIISGQSTVGITGRAYSTTYARNSAEEIKDGLSLSYTPQCGGGSGSQVQPVERIKLSSDDGNQKIRSKFLISLQAVSSGSVELGFSFGTMECSAKASISMVKEKTRIRGRVPSALARRYSRMRVSAGTLRSARPLENGQSVSNRRESLSQDQFDTLCSRVVQSLRVN